MYGEIMVIIRATCENWAHLTVEVTGDALDSLLGPGEGSLGGGEASNNGR